MLELSKIGFTVETGPLVDAVNKVQDLGKAIEGLATSMGKLDQKAAKANATQTESNLLNAKAADVVVKTEDNVTVAKTKSLRVTEQLTTATEVNTGILQRQKDILSFQSQGFSKGQSSILAMAKAAGVLETDLKALGTVLETQRKLMSGDPFDKSAGALKSLRNEYALLTDIQRQYTAESSLTQKQMKDLAIDKIRLIESMKAGGKTFGDTKTAMRALKTEYTDIANSVNQMTTKTAAADKAVKDSAKANDYLEKELTQVRTALQANNAELGRSSSNALVKFDSALKKSGMSLDEQKRKMDEYRAATAKLNAAKKADQTDYLTRAIAPQITDIGVGLMTGQSPLTIALQQGGQLRDQFGQFNVQGKEMAAIMRNSMSKMASSVFDTMKAIGGLVVGGFVDAGKAVMNFGMEITGMNKAVDIAKRYFASLGEAGFGMIGTMEKIGKAMSAVFAVGALAVISALITLGLELAKLVKQENELSNSILLTGASLGMSKDQAVAYSEGLRSIGLTAEQARTALTEFAKAGVNGGESTAGLIKAAVDLEKYTGQAVEKTVQEYKKLQEDPVKALTDLAIGTGMVTTATIDHIDALVKSGDQAQAVTEAQKIMAASLQDVANEARDGLSPISVLWIDIKDAIKNVKDAIVELGTSNEVVTVLSGAFKTLAFVISSAWWVAKSLVQSLAAADAIRLTILTEGPTRGLAVAKEWASSMKDGYDQHRAYTSSLFDSNEAAKTGVALSAEQKQMNSEAAKANAVINKLQDEFADKKTKRDDKSALALANYTVQIKAAGTNEKEINRLISERDKLLDNIANKLKDKKEAKTPKTPKSDAEKENDAIVKYYAKVKERVSDLNIELEGVADKSTKADKILKDLYNDKEWKKNSNGRFTAIQEEIKKELEKASLREKENKELEKQKKLQEDIGAIQRDNANFIEKEQLDRTKLTKSYELRLNLLGKTEEQQKVLKDQAELEQKIIESTLKFDQKRFEIKEKFKKLAEKEGVDRFEIAAAEAKELTALDRARAEDRKLIDKGVSVSARESYIAEMQKVAKPISDAITTALFEGGQAGAKSLRDSVAAAFRNKISVWIEANVMGTLTGGSGGGSGGSIGDSITGMASSASSFLSGGSTVAGWLGGSTGVAGQFMSGMSGSASAASAMMGGAELTTAASMGSSFGSLAATAAPWIAGAGALMAAFGTGGYELKPMGTYLSGSIGTDKSNVATLQEIEQTGGGFLNKRTTINGEWSEAGSGINDYLDSTSKTVTKSVKGWAESIRLSADAINGFSKDVKIDISGLNPAQQKEAIDKAFGSFADDMVSSAYGATIAAFAKNGETASQTLQRLSTSLTTVTSVFKAMGFEFTAVGIEGATAATKIVDAFGGLEKFSASMSSFYDNFYTENEKTAFVTKSLTSQFSSLGITMPAVNESTREWYRSEVERQLALDQSIPAIAQATAALLALQDGLNQIAPAVDKTAENIKSAMSGLTDTRFDLENQLLTLKGRTDEVAARTRDNDISKLVDGVTPEGAAQITAAYDYNLELKAQIKAQEDAADAQRDYQNSLRQAAQESIKAAEQIRTAWQSITDSLYDEVKRIRGLVMGDTSVGLSAAQSDFNNATARARAGDQEAAKALPALSQVLLTLAQGQASTLIELRRAQALTANSLEQTANGISSAYGLSIPAYASGGSYDGGLALVGEQGPELINFSNPGQVYTASQTASMMNGSSEMVSELKRLNSKIDNLEAAARSSAISNNKVAKILDLVTPERTSVVISGTVTTV